MFPGTLQTYRTRGLKFRCVAILGPPGGKLHASSLKFRVMRVQLGPASFDKIVSAMVVLNTTTMYYS